MDHLCDNIYFFGSHQDKISFLNQKMESGFALHRHSLKYFFYFIQNCYVIQELLLILWKVYFHYCRKVIISCRSNCICCQLHDFFRMMYQPSSNQTGGYSHWILSRIFIIWKESRLCRLSNTKKESSYSWWLPIKRCIKSKRQDKNNMRCVVSYIK